MIEPASLSGACEIEVKTAANGFGATWQAVMADFHARWLLADAHISINDMGATPAVVSLRLDQAVETMTGGRP
jgi:malonate decarboxylase delta subunit